MIKPAIILLTWQRIFNLETILSQLSKQTYKDFDVFISNGDPRYFKEVSRIANKTNLNITVWNHNNDLYTFRRLHIGKDLATQGYEVIMFIDDDISIPDYYVERAIQQYEPQSYKSCYSWKFFGKNYYSQREKVFDVNAKVNYCGTATSILDAKIFLEPGIFHIGSFAHKIEDLWLSYYAQHVLGWKLQHLDIPGVEIGGSDKQALHRQVLSEKNNKRTLLDFLVKKGWDIS